MKKNKRPEADAHVVPRHATIDFLFLSAVNADKKNEVMSSKIEINIQST
jgi:hypothetical protein